MQLNYFISFFVLLLLTLVVSADVYLGDVNVGNPDEGSGSGEEAVGQVVEEEPQVLKAEGLLGSEIASSSSSSTTEVDGSGIEASGEDVQTFLI